MGICSYKKGGVLMFDISLEQITDSAEVEKLIKSSNKLVICAGRWGPMCIPVYRAMEQINKDYEFQDVLLRVVDFDSEAAGIIRSLEQCKNFRGLPFTVYFLNGNAVCATSSIQPRQQIEDNIKNFLFQGGGSSNESL
jgi:thioredoxin 1